MSYKIRIAGNKRKCVVCYIDGKRVSRKTLLKRYPKAFEDPDLKFKLSSLVGWKPLVSDALAVHPRQIAEARADAAKKGVPTDFMPDGRPILRTRQHRAAYLKAYGFFDRSAGYGDPADGSFRERPDPVDPAKEIHPEFGCRVAPGAHEQLVREIMGQR